MHPSTVLTAAACGWLIVVAVNRPWASAAVLAVALALGTLVARGISVVATTVALSLPAAASMVLIHAPYGEHRVAPLLTSDGLVLSGALSLRFAALMGCVLASAASLKVADIAKWLQGSRLGYKVAYVVGSSLQSIPQGAQAVAAVRDANLLAGVKIGVHTVLPRLVIPVIARLLTQGAQRGQALAAIGFDEPGPRTVLEPVDNPGWQRALRWAMVVATLAVCGVALWS